MNNLSHKIELDPNDRQSTYFKKACGIQRFAYNWALAEWEVLYKAGEPVNPSILNKKLNKIKRTEYPWMMEVMKRVPQQGVLNLGRSFSKFLRKESSYPKFKKKGLRDSFRADDGPNRRCGSAVKVVGKYVKLYTVGRVKMKEELRLKGRIMSVTVSRTADRWFASFNVEVDHKVPVRENQAVVGVDLGVKDLAVLSDGTKFEGPKALKNN